MSKTLLKTKKKRLPYSKRNDIDRLKANWTKVRGLYTRQEWSTVILRVVTSVELAANYVLRKELIEKRGMEEYFVNNLLVWANGIRGKFDKLLIPLFKKNEFENELKKINKIVQEINIERNKIAHGGQFKRKETAIKIIKESKIIIEVLINKYEKDFELKKIP